MYQSKFQTQYENDFLYQSKYRTQYENVEDGYGQIIGFTSTRTGEYFDAVNALVPAGSRILTPEDQERAARFREMEREREKKAKAAKRRKLTRQKGGHYYFMSAQSDYNDLSPANAARLVYLATYMGYKDNRLEFTERTPIKKSDLAVVLRLSVSATRRFLAQTGGVYIFTDDSGALFLSPEHFHRGNGAGSGYSWTSQTLFNESVRALYEQTPPHRHCYLGRVFQMLPYVNREYNAVCHNPLEQELDNIDFVSLREFCELIGYSDNQQARLMREYKNIVFPVKGRMEQFCAFVTNGGDLSTTRIYVNPRVLYRGSDYDSVRVLGKFAEAASG